MLVSNGPIFSETENVLMKMNDSAFIFYLTGSRFFGTSKPTSDWDFFIQYSKSTPNLLVGWLVGKGFTSSEQAQYEHDGHCIRVFEFQEELSKSDIDQTWDCRATKIQVQLVENAQIKNAVQNRLLKLYPKGTFIKDKKQAAFIWKLAFNFCQLGFDLSSELNSQQ